MNSVTGRVKKILIIDDHPVIFDGLQLLLKEERDLEVWKLVGPVRKIKAKIKKINPDLVIADLNLKIGMNGIELTRILKEQFHDISILILSMYDEEIYAERALKAGARGYIMKQEMTKSIINAIRNILGGQIFLSDKMKMRLSV